MLEQGGLFAEVSMNPYERRDVAVLRTIAPSSRAGWSLKQKVSVVEEEPHLNRQKTSRNESDSGRGRFASDRQSGQVSPPLQQPETLTATHPSRRASYNRVYSVNRTVRGPVEVRHRRAQWRVEMQPPHIAQTQRSKFLQARVK